MTVEASLFEAVFEWAGLKMVAVYTNLLMATTMAWAIVSSDATQPATTSSIATSIAPRMLKLIASSHVIFMTDDLSIITLEVVLATSFMPI